jgi:acetyl-CoA C-acetyltransferase
MISTPYRKWLVSDWNVDQAAAFVITSVGAARAAGIDPERWVTPLVVAESNFMVPVSARADIARSPAMEAIGDALRAAGSPAAGVDLVELYSCFPAAVQVQAAALGIDPWQGWTQSGGMTFGGGPLNNFVLQSTAVVARALRERRGRTAVVTAVSGMITKVGAIAWGVGLPPAGDPAALAIDVSAEAEARTEVRPVVADLDGQLRIVAHTIAHGREGPVQAIVLAEDGAGRRTIATSSDPAVIDRLSVADHVGGKVVVAAATIESLTTATTDG